MSTNYDGGSATAVPRSDLPLGAHSVKVTIAACVLAAFCEGFDLQAAGVAAAGIVPEFKPTPDQMGTFFSASTFGLFVGALVGGRLSDSFGRKRTLVVSIALFGIFSISNAHAWNIDSLILARFLTGLGLGGAFPTLVAWVNECSAPHRRRANVALVYSAMPMGGAVVSLISMLISTSYWRAIFVTGGVAPLILAPCMQWALREHPPYSVPVSAAENSDSPVAEAAMPKAGSFLAIFSDGRALPTLLLWISCFLGLVTVYLMLSWLPTLLLGSGFSKTQAGVAQIAFNVGGALSALLLGQLLEGELRNPSILATFIAAPLLVFLLSKTSKDVVEVALIAFALGGALLAAQGYFYGAAARAYPASIRGVGSGATVAAGRLGSVAGPKLGGMLKAAGHGSSQLFLDILPLVIIGSAAALVFVWVTSRREDRDKSPPACA